MKQVLCLSSLLEDDDIAAMQLLDGRQVGDEIASSDGLPIVDVPHKNTFIHYEIPRSPDSQSSPPTTSAPGVLLQRLFKTKTDNSFDNTADIAQDMPRAVSSSGSIDSSPTYPALYDHDSDASTSAEGSPSAAPSFALPHQGSSLEMVQRHEQGQCTPCNYFWYKVDGCRQGSDCMFCHLCPKGEIKKRKRDKVKQLRKAGVLSHHQ